MFLCLELIQVVSSCPNFFPIIFRCRSRLKAIVEAEAKERGRRCALTAFALLKGP